MAPLNFAEIEKQARQMRAEELARVKAVFSARLHGLLATSLAAASRGLRHLFSWNPQAGNIRTVD